MLIPVKKYQIILVCVAALFCNLHRLYDGTDFRIDIYPFYDYAEHSKYEGRKISKILYEYGIHISRLIGFFLLWRVSRKVVFFIVFFYFAFDTLGYILVFGQGWNPYTILATILITFIFICIKIWKRRNRIKYIGSSL
jgi:hypothetical protein